MKRVLLVLVVFMLVCSVSFAWEILSYPPPLKGGDILIDAGLGLRGLSANEKWRIPPLFVQFEYALPIKLPISVGGMAALYQWKWEYIYRDNAGNYHDITEIRTIFNAAGRANWHWAFPVDWLDFYTGVHAGYRYGFVDVNKQVPGHVVNATNKFDWGTQAGAHFYFTKNLGAMAEFGYPYWIKAGVAFKF
jgi:hypothetical protein